MIQGNSGKVSQCFFWVPGMLLTSILALKTAPMSLVIVLRNTSPLGTLVIERFYPEPLRISSFMLGSIFLMIAGGVTWATCWEKIYENLMGYCMNVHMRILYVIAYYIHAIQDVLMGNMLMFYHSPCALQFLGDVCDATSTRELAGNWLGLPEQRHCSGRSFVATLAALEGTMPSGYLQDRHHVDQQSGRNASSGNCSLCHRRDWEVAIGLWNLEPLGHTAGILIINIIDLPWYWDAASDVNI